MEQREYVPSASHRKLRVEPTRAVMGAPMHLPGDMFGDERQRHNRSVLSSLKRRVRSERIEAGLRPVSVPESLAVTAPVSGREFWLHPTKGWRTRGASRAAVQR